MWLTKLGLLALVSDVTSSPYRGKVYNLEVEGDNSYLTYFAVHNCLEANCCGTLAIGLMEGGVPEMISPGVSGFLCSTVDGVKEAIKKLSDDPPTAKTSRRVRDYVESRFHYHGMCKDYISLINRVESGSWW